MAVLVAGDNLKEERRPSLKVFGYSVDLSPVRGRESQLGAPLQEGCKVVTEIENFIEAERNLPR